MNRLPKPLERQVQTDCIKLLSMKGYYVQRINSGRIPMGEGRSRRMIHMAEVGTPDLMAFKFFDLGFNGEGDYLDLIFVECKREGEKPTTHQEHKMRELESYGARCIVAHSSKELEEQL